MFSLLYVVDSACWLHDIEKKCLRNDFIYTTFKQSPEFPRLEWLQWEHLEMNVHISLRSLKTGLRFCRLSLLAQAGDGMKVWMEINFHLWNFSLILIEEKKLQKSIIQQKQNNNEILSHKTQRSRRRYTWGHSMGSSCLVPIGCWVTCLQWKVF